MNDLQTTKQPVQIPTTTASVFVATIITFGVCYCFHDLLKVANNRKNQPGMYQR